MCGNSSVIYRVLAEYILGILDLANKFANNIDIEPKEPKIKIKIQSPGYIKFIGKVTFILIIGIVFVGVCGGEINCNLKDGDVSIKTDGLIKQIVDSYIKIQDAENIQKIRELQGKLMVEGISVINKENK